MSELGGLVDLLFPFFGTIVLGLVVGKLARFTPAHLVALNVFLVYAALPCLFFRLIAGKPISDLANPRFIAVTTASTALAFALSWLAGRAAGLPPPDRVMGAVIGSYSNIGYMGPPLVVSLLGSAASAPVALILVFDTIFLFAATPALMAVTGLGRRPALAMAREVAVRVVFHPFMLATGVGVVASLAGWHEPPAIATVVTWLSGASAPCALFLLGATVATQRVGLIGREVGWLVAVKLVGHPAIVWLGLLLVGGVEPTWVKAAIVMAALPPALNVFVLAHQYRVGIERASASVLVGTVLSIATLSVLILLLRADLLPLAIR